MGCDIHLYVERRKSPDAPWECVPPPQRDMTKYPLTDQERQMHGGRAAEASFWGPGECLRNYQCFGHRNDDCAGATCPGCGGTGLDLQWYSNRNYEVFSVLADVRNRYGITPIAAPRGEPADMTPMVLASKSWDHSESWLTLDELVEYDWDAATNHSGIIPVFSEASRSGFAMESFEEWILRCDGKKSPHSFCQGMGGRKVSLDDARKLIAATPEQKAAVLRDSGNQPIVQVSWQETGREFASDFLGFVEEFLEPLAGPEYAATKAVLDDAREENGGPGHKHEALIRDQWLVHARLVRIVFGFDS